MSIRSPAQISPKVVNRNKSTQTWLVFIQRKCVFFLSFSSKKKYIYFCLLKIWVPIEEPECVPRGGQPLRWRLWSWPGVCPVPSVGPAGRRPCAATGAIRPAWCKKRHWTRLSRIWTISRATAITRACGSAIAATISRHTVVVSWILWSIFFCGYFTFSWALIYIWENRNPSNNNSSLGWIFKLELQSFHYIV